MRFEADHLYQVYIEDFKLFHFIAEVNLETSRWVLNMVRRRIALSLVSPSP